MQPRSNSFDNALRPFFSLAAMDDPFSQEFMSRSALSGTHESAIRMLCFLHNYLVILSGFMKSKAVVSKSCVDGDTKMEVKKFGLYL